MRRMWPIAVTVLGLGALGVANVLRASLGNSAEAREVQTRLDRLPMTIGPWTGTPTTVPEKQLRIAQAQAHLSRTYVNNKDGAAVGVLVLYGDPGQLGAHTPEVCYEGAGFKQITNVTTREVPGESAEFRTARFETAGYPPTSIQVVWGWGADGVWKASETPRLDFAGRRLIYKLYVSRTLPPGVVQAERDPLDEFLGPFLKEFKAAVTRPPDQPGPPPPG